MTSKEIEQKIEGYASNNVDALTMYITRKRYHDEAMSQGISGIDMWYDKQNYGKIDQFGNSVFISESNLKQIKSKNGTILVADFVADAYNDWREYISRSILTKKIIMDGDTILKALEAKKGWQSVEKLYYPYIDNLYKIFITFYVRKNGRDAKILSYDTFLEQFLLFYELYRNDGPITKVGYITSKLCNAMISGLCIEISEDDPSDDSIKMSKYLNDPNFEYYRKSLKKHGFLIDKNAPWRIVADVASPKMQSYMVKYGIKTTPGNVDDLFEIYYYQACEWDISALKVILRQFYNSYVASYPFLKEVSLGENGHVLSKISHRLEVSEDATDEQHGELFWLQYYFDLRILESNIKWSDKHKEVELKKILQIYKYIDYQSALHYVNKKTLL